MSLKLLACEKIVSMSPLAVSLTLLSKAPQSLVFVPVSAEFAWVQRKEGEREGKGEEERVEKEASSFCTERKGSPWASQRKRGLPKGSVGTDARKKVGYENIPYD